MCIFDYLEDRQADAAVRQLLCGDALDVLELGQDDGLPHDQGHEVRVPDGELP